MGLWEYMQKRMKELGITVKDLEDKFDIVYATIQRIKSGRGHAIKDGTKQKLALALQCSVGDINNAIYELQNLKPSQGDTEEAPVMETVDKLEQMVEEEYPELGTEGSKAEPATEAAKTTMEIMDKERHRVAHIRPDGTEPVLKLKEKAIKKKAENQQKEKPVLRFIKNDPLPEEKWPEDPPEEKPDKIIREAASVLKESIDEYTYKRVRREAVSEYKQKLKDICLRTYVNVPTVNLSGETPAGLIGRALMEEILKDDTGAE